MEPNDKSPRADDLADVWTALAHDIADHAMRPLNTREDVVVEVDEYSSASEVPLTLDQKTFLVNEIWSSIRATKAKTWQPGDRATIYCDPITEQTPEGKATLVKCLDADVGTQEGRVMQRWQVRFDAEPGLFDRFILSPELGD